MKLENLGLKSHVLPAAPGEKVWRGAEIIFKYIFLFYDTSCNITQQLIKTNC